MLIEALSWAAAAFGSLVALPQVVKLFQTGAAAGVSLAGDLRRQHRLDRARCAR